MYTYVNSEEPLLVNCGEHSFLKRIEWADEHLKYKWINVEDDLPRRHKKLITTDNCFEKATTPVITVNKYGIIEDNYMVLYDDGKWEWKYGAMPCYWMLIPPKLPKEIEIELTK